MIFEKQFFSDFETEWNSGVFERLALQYPHTPTLQCASNPIYLLPRQFGEPCATARQEEVLCRLDIVRIT